MNPKTRISFLLSPLSCLLLFSGCTSKSRPAPQVVVPAIQFTDVTKQAGIDFQHTNGAFGLRMMPETIGSGVCVFDYDGDGWPDIYFVNGREWSDKEIKEYLANSGKPQHGKVDLPKNHKKVTGTLHRNVGNGTFQDVTKGSGLEVEICGQGASAADYDGDGKTDLYVTAWPHNYLFRNQGNGKFIDVTKEAGVAASNWSSAAVWLDFNKDGYLDLFVGRYLNWSPKLEKYNTAVGIHGPERAYGGPDFYQGLTPILYLNRGDGTFQDVSLKMGVASLKLQGKTKPLLGKTLGAVALDYDRDGWMDIAVCNDRIRNFLFHNRQGRFEEVAEISNFAFANNGTQRAGMGVDATDTDHSAYESLAVGNFDQERLGLFQNFGGKMFWDVALLSDAGRASFNRLTFGCVFADFDNDTWPDVMAANGHIQPGVDGVRRDTAHAQAPLLLKNTGPQQMTSPLSPTEKFSYATFTEPAAWINPMPHIVGRGLAAADFDRDGDVDAIFSSNGGPALLLRNDSVGQGHSLRITLLALGTNHEAIGAVVWAETGKVSLRRTVRAGNSYVSQSELPLTFGLGAIQTIETLTVRWPSEKTSVFNNVKADQEMVISETKGIISTTSLKARSGL